MYQVQPLHAFTDNYIWIIKNNLTKQCAVIDPGTAEPVLQWLSQNNAYQLSTILITHHHQDHTGGIAKLVEHTSAAVWASNPNTPNLSLLLSDQQTINLLGLTLEVIAVPGHTLDHIAYYSPQQASLQTPWLFSGDTLFSAGCGRVFEGTMLQMYQSLQRLNQLPEETKIFPAHEYTINNLQFALSIEPSNKEIKNQLAHCQDILQQQMTTLPSTLSTERKINPFLKCEQIDIIEAAQRYIREPLVTPEAVFSALRDWKNHQS